MVVSPAIFTTMEIKFLLLISLVPLTYSEPNMCGMPQPDAMKSCVSIRLPWQPEPIYFCIEKEKFKYRNPCMGQQMSCGLNMREDTLLIATPWDCCPMVSVPDHCTNSWCPPKPMNRECKLLDMDNSIYGDCCQKYFCEANANPQDCHLKQMQLECNTPPKDKMNCVGFYDMYGCCTKYQCQGEGKPGMCPMEAHAKHINSMMMPPNGTGSMPANPAPVSRGSDSYLKAGTTTLYPRVVPPPMGMNNQHSTLNREQQPPLASMQMFSHDVYPVYGAYPMKTIPCINDNNCEGAQKCCSSDISVYTAGPHMMRNPHPTHGYCTEPIMS